MNCEAITQIRAMFCWPIYKCICKTAKSCYDCQVTAKFLIKAFSSMHWISDTIIPGTCYVVCLSVRFSCINYIVKSGIACQGGCISAAILAKISAWAKPQAPADP